MLKKDKKESKYERCEECCSGVLIVFESSDKKKRCARCKMMFDEKQAVAAMQPGTVKKRRGRKPKEKS